MSHTSKLTEPKEGVVGTSDLQPVGQKEARVIIWTCNCALKCECVGGHVRTQDWVLNLSQRIVWWGKKPPHIWWPECRNWSYVWYKYRKETPSRDLGFSPHRSEKPGVSLYIRVLWANSNRIYCTNLKSWLSFLQTKGHTLQPILSNKGQRDGLLKIKASTENCVGNRNTGCLNGGR